MLEPNVLIGAGVGFVFGFLIGWLVGLKKKEKKPKVMKKELPADAMAFLNAKEPFEVFDVHVAHVDVERQATIGVMHHIDDLIDEMKESGELNHLLRLVILGYEAEGERLTQNTQLCNHFLRIQEERPYLAVFLDKKSMQTYLQFLIAGRKQHGQIPEHPIEPPIEKLEQEIVGHTTQFFTAQFADRPQVMSKLLDQVLARLEGVCGDMQRVEQERLNAAMQPSTTHTK